MSANQLTNVPPVPWSNLNVESCNVVGAFSSNQVITNELLVNDFAVINNCAFNGQMTVPISPTAPAGSDGDIYYNSTTNTFFFYHGGWNTGTSGSQGPAGSQGATGPAGSQGATGPSGDVNPTFDTITVSNTAN